MVVLHCNRNVATLTRRRGDLYLLVLVSAPSGPISHQHRTCHRCCDATHHRLVIRYLFTSNVAYTLNTRYLKVDIVMLSNDSDELALPDNHESYCVTLGVRVCVLLHAVTW